ncbi:TIGR03915 family putative DNA repair protein [Enterococcus sp. AZ192]|uniref:TIGR03915 family putative DNA repair protein n=1 Tax=unclassified Enterococcus TaxID=2608891 RepID=UPI003D2924E6
MSIEETNEVWEYDGSYYGFLTIVYHAFKKNSFPEMILTPENSVETLFISEWFETDEELAKKIYQRLEQRLKKENLQFIIDGFYCSLKEKERCLLDAIQIALSTNDSLTNHLGHPSILALQKSLKALFSEVHLFTGFVRFEYVGAFLYSQIAPKHFSLPYLCPHFAQRYPNETLMIYDETHRLLGIIEQAHIRFIENTDPPVFHAQSCEQEVQDNWRTFLRAVTIEERKNEQVQLSHLPKRFRGNMVDFRE